MKWMKKWFVAMMLLCVGIGQGMAQKNIDKLAEELEKRDDVAINSITKRDPKTRKITRVVKTFSLKDERMAKRLIEAFEKDEEYAVSAIKDMPKGRKSALRVNFTFIYQNDDEKHTYTLSSDVDGTVNMTIIIRQEKAKGHEDYSFLFNPNIQLDKKMFDEMNEKLKKSLKGLENLNFDSLKGELGGVIVADKTHLQDDGDLILEGNVSVGGKKMKKGTYTIDGRRVVVR